MVNKFKERTAPIVEQTTGSDGTTLVKISLVQARATGPYSFQELTVEEATALAAELTEAAG